MSKYFHISSGLRGCYTPDNAAIIRVDTRRELKNYIEWEARDYRDAGFIGANKRAIARIAAVAWREAGKPRNRQSVYPYCLELAPSHARDNYCHGIFVSTATRAEFLEFCEESDW